MKVGDCVFHRKRKSLGLGEVIQVSKYNDRYAVQFTGILIWCDLKDLEETGSRWTPLKELLKPKWLDLPE